MQFYGRDSFLAGSKDLCIPYISSLCSKLKFVYHSKFHRKIENIANKQLEKKSMNTIEQKKILT